jgi:serine protease Do
MRKALKCAFVLVLTAVVCGGSAAPLEAQFNRKSPIVEVVRKTKKGIVTLKVNKPGSWGNREVVGTGVIVDERGYVVTAHHVIANATSIAVHLHDKTVLKAAVHTEDVSNDMAILRVSPKNVKLHALPFGPGSDLEVGETVIAIGNPYGYVRSVTTGIISALERQITMPTGAVLTNLTQTNAAVNPGNSGGPLFNINGEWIGMIVALREGAQNIGFALNIDTVKAVVMKNLSANKMAQLKHGLIVKEQVASEGKDRQKVVVESVAARSPAARAGLKSGDVILQVAGRAVQNRFDVERALWSYKPGDRIETTILRAGRETRVAMTLAGPKSSSSSITALPRPRR